MPPAGFLRCCDPPRPCAALPLPPTAGVAHPLHHRSTPNPPSLSCWEGGEAVRGGRGGGGGHLLAPNNSAQFQGREVTSRRKRNERFGRPSALRGADQSRPAAPRRPQPQPRTAPRPAVTAVTARGRGCFAFLFAPQLFPLSGRDNEKKLRNRSCSPGLQGQRLFPAAFNVGDLLG